MSVCLNRKGPSDNFAHPSMAAAGRESDAHLILQNGDKISLSLSTPMGQPGTVDKSYRGVTNM